MHNLLYFSNHFARTIYKSHDQQLNIIIIYIFSAYF